MAKIARGKHYRKGITLAELFQMFPDDKTAEQWFVKSRWANEIRCAYCESDNVNTKAKHATIPYRSRECGKRFSVKTNSLMQASNLGYQKWAIAIYLFATSLKGVSSMKLHRDLGITQKSAWHMLHRIRKSWETVNEVFLGEVEETYIGGKEGNKYSKKKLKRGRGTAGKIPVAGLKERETNTVQAKVVKFTNRPTLQTFVTQNTSPGTIVYTDNTSAYHNLPRLHVTVSHSIGEYVKHQAHTNGIESFWATLKRGYKGVYHKMSPKHLQRYIDEFCHRYNKRYFGTMNIMTDTVKRGVGRRAPSRVARCSQINPTRHTGDIRPQKRETFAQREGERLPPDQSH